MADSTVMSIPSTQGDTDSPQHTQMTATFMDTPQQTTIGAMSAKTTDEIAKHVEAIFVKLQRNLEHNASVFHDKARTLLGRVEQAEEQLRRVLEQLDDSAGGAENVMTRPEESIMLSEEMAPVVVDSVADPVMTVTAPAAASTVEVISCNAADETVNFISVQ